MDFGDVQKLAETEINVAGMLALFLVLAAFGFIIWTWKRPSPKTTDNEENENVVLAKVFGGIISRELKTMIDSLSADKALSTIEHKSIADAINNNTNAIVANTETQKLIVELLTNHDRKADDNRVIITQLSNNMDQTNEAVQIMNTDIEQIKADLATLTTTVDNINQRLESGLPMSDDSLAIMQRRRGQNRMSYLPSLDEAVFLVLVAESAAIYLSIERFIKPGIKNVCDIVSAYFSRVNISKEIQGYLVWITAFVLCILTAWQLDRATFADMINYHVDTDLKQVINIFVTACFLLSGDEFMHGAWDWLHGKAIPEDNEPKKTDVF
jgi:hypothetical protein